MKLRHLRAFVAVADTGSFVGAARTLNLVQAALSKQVAALEGELGARLFVRGPREVALTEAGAALLDEARRMVELSDRAVSRTRAAADRASGTLRVAYCELLRSHESILARGFAALGTHHPGLAVSAFRMSSAEQWQALRERQIQVGIGYGEPEDVELEHQPLARVSIGSVLLPAGHPLACTRPFHFRDLDGFPLLIFPREVNPLLHDGLMAGLRSRGLEPCTRRWVHSQAAQEAAVRAGHGWMLATEGIPESPDGLTVCAVDDAPIGTSLSLWWARAAAGPSVQLFVDAVTAGRA